MSIIPDLLRSIIALATVCGIGFLLWQAIASKRGGLRWLYGLVLVLIFGSTLFLPFDHETEYGTLRFWFCYYALGYAAIGKANFGVGAVDVLVELVTLAHTYMSVRLSEIVTYRGILLALKYMNSGSDSR